jgi:hypothetical protein
LPTVAEWWQNYNYQQVIRSDMVIVLTLEGWTQSKGVAYEVEVAKSFHKPVYYMETNYNAASA